MVVLESRYDRAVAWELVELAWIESGENWFDETLDGQPYDLPEPGEGETWTRQDFQLPPQGVLKVTPPPPLPSLLHLSRMP